MPDTGCEVPDVGVDLFVRARTGCAVRSCDVSGESWGGEEGTDGFVSFTEDEEIDGFCEECEIDERAVPWAVTVQSNGSACSRIGNLIKGKWVHETQGVYSREAGDTRLLMTVMKLPVSGVGWMMPTKPFYVGIISMCCIWGGKEGNLPRTQVRSDQR